MQPNYQSRLRCSGTTRRITSFGLLSYIIMGTNVSQKYTFNYAQDGNLLTYQSLRCHEKEYNMNVTYCALKGLCHIRSNLIMKFVTFSVFGKFKFKIH